MLPEPLSCVPETHTVSAKLQLGNEREKLQAASERAQLDGRGSVWIVKPNGLNRGAGIAVVRGIGAPRHCLLCSCTAPFSSRDA